MKREELRAKIFGIVLWRGETSSGGGASPLEQGAEEGDSPVYPCRVECTVRLQRVELFGIAALSGW